MNYKKDLWRNLRFKIPPFDVDVLLVGPIYRGFYNFKNSRSMVVAIENGNYTFWRLANEMVDTPKELRIVRLQNKTKARRNNVAYSDSSEKDPAAVELGRKGGKIGGVRRAKNLTPERRTEIAKLAAAVRWGK